MDKTTMNAGTLPNDIDAPADVPARREGDLDENDVGELLDRLTDAERSGLIYLATPYSHDDANIKKRRFEVVNRAAAVLMSEGLHIYSPISHTHPIALAGSLPDDWDYWQEPDEKILRMCSAMVVLRQEGWRQSKGVTAEIAIAQSLFLKIEFLEP